MDIFATLTVIIPSLEPGWELVDYVKELGREGFSHVILVNDGSPASSDGIFEVLSALEHCTVLTHPKNLGKGAALKTAYGYVAEHLPQCRGVVTADGDGQHAVGDVVRLAKEVLDKPGAFILGGREFSGAHVPSKSRWGNRCSSAVFYLLHGTWVPDTQTGLRGFDTCYLVDMMAISGERFDYETAVLTAFASRKIPIGYMPIETIYIDDNGGTHFRPVQDSLAIGRVLLSRPLRFCLSSGLSCVVDIGLCWALLALLTGFMANHLLRIAIAVTLARLVSLSVNFLVNKAYVFKGRGSFPRYLMLAGGNILASICLIYLARTVLPMDERLAKLLVDAVLFFVNYQVQRLWVFPTAQKGDAF